MFHLPRGPCCGSELWERLPSKYVFRKNLAVNISSFGEVRRWCHRQEFPRSFRHTKEVVRRSPNHPWRNTSTPPIFSFSLLFFFFMTYLRLGQENKVRNMKEGDLIFSCVSSKNSLVSYAPRWWIHLHLKIVENKYEKGKWQRAKILARWVMKLA